MQYDISRTVYCAVTYFRTRNLRLQLQKPLLVRSGSCWIPDVALSEIDLTTWQHSWSVTNGPLPRQKWRPWRGAARMEFSSHFVFQLPPSKAVRASESTRAFLALGVNPITRCSAATHPCGSSAEKLPTNAQLGLRVDATESKATGYPRPEVYLYKLRIGKSHRRD